MGERVLDIDQAPVTDETTFFKKREVKRVLICFHGFQTSATHDLKPFKEYFDSINKNPDLEVELVNLYDFGSPKTYNTEMMFSRGEKAVKSYLEKGYVVYLMAYSFSVGIAAKLCVEFPSIEKLVLVSPTIYIVKTGLLPGYVKMLGKRMEFNRKYRKEKKHQAVIKKTKANNTGVVKLAFRISHAILKYRKYLKEIRCKMLLIKGKKDELSIPQTFTYITKKTEKAITMIKVYPEENHIMIMSLSHGKRAYDDILRFVYHFSSGEENEDL